MAASKENLDVFLHIPKTAGTSFNTLLTRAYGAQYVVHLPASPFDDGAHRFASLSADDQANTRLLRGHIVHGMHHNTERPTRYFTILREPLGRIQSFLNHMASQAALAPDSDNPLHYAVRNWKDFETFAVLRPRQVNNYMVSALSGIKFERGACNDEILGTAIRNLEAMPTFGIQEYLAESILLMRQDMRWRALPIVSRAKYGNPQRIVLSDHDKSAIRAWNQFDQRLYDHAVDLFEKRLNASLRRHAAVIHALTPMVSKAESMARAAKRSLGAIR